MTEQPAPSLADDADITIADLESAKRMAILATTITIRQVRRITDEMDILRKKIHEFNQLVVEKMDVDAETDSKSDN